MNHLVTVGFIDMRAPNSAWQVLFRKGGADYCRETKPSTTPVDTVIAWAQNECERRGLTARIERW